MVLLPTIIVIIFFLPGPECSVAGSRSGEHLTIHRVSWIVGTFVQYIISFYNLL